MKDLAKVVIVGKPNVGKSSLFNRITQKRTAITTDTPQTTRDRIYGTAQWLTKEFVVIDTGGISFAKVDFQTEINSQANIALNEADVVIFLCSYQEGLTVEDEEIAKLLYKIKKPIIIAANKYDQVDNSDLVADFLALGFGWPILISASHGIGIGELLDQVILKLGDKTATELAQITNLAVIGRPNVGKSSLVNAILAQNRVIVSPIAGTTTDAVDTYFQHNKQKYCLIDTAGIRRKGKVTENIEKYSAMRTVDAVKRSDVILFLIDASEGIIEQDLTVAGIAKNLDKPVIIVVNKWDLVKNDEQAMIEFTKKIKAKFKYLDYALVTFLSALKKTRISNLFKTIQIVLTNMEIRIKTSALNEVLNKAQLVNQAPNFNGGRLKIYYATQVETSPPTFILMVNNKKYCHFSYQRFLINQIRDNFAFQGVPLKILFRNRKSLYKEEK
ncbi:ribosome biogenesis GTPase Der [Spiroplasma platyhelix]|uniref:GTPase Der n=1 Tax=Spiroplasma platyhelix PALS-1 TaxID=1276218 RepID=A0A846TVY1_9MOLU|nr:ribosome biogenesis GTPase Der [Spiroplasma platyhelix]MBE4703939.1 GTPase Der [Spiroplasma platyhelix PALS-1]NKE38312.1 ribosome biogenesis GTPase Der [Spiroplasma platyhelix PALS-1]UJB29197.1 GTP-binding protein EngA [Spiroplasma platyhelix PALS-1]